MRIHLLIPASTNLLGSRLYAQFQPGLMPMSLTYLGAVLRRAGHVVSLRDQPASLMPNRRVLDEIMRQDPHLLGLSVLTESWGNTLALCAEVRRRRPQLPLVMGNIHASFFAGQILRQGHADFIVRGEGEETLKELAAALEAGQDPADVPGLSWRCGDEVRHNPDRPPIQDLDALPYPAWDLLDRSAWRYQRFPLLNLRTPGVPLMASRGCPHDCVFCAQDGGVHRFRRRRVEHIVAEVAYMVERYGFEAFGFNDSYFPWSRASGLEFCDRLQRLPWHRQVKWVTQLRADPLDDDLMGAMRASGLHAIACGFESGNDRILQGIRKGTTVDQGRELIRAAHRHGVLVIGFFMVGLPGETPETIADTVRFAVENRVDIAKFAVAVPFPGSGLWPLLGKDELTVEECGRFTSWSGWTGSGDTPLWAPEGMSPGELVRLQRRGMARFYGRPSYLWQVLRKRLFSLDELARGGMLLLSGGRGAGWVRK